MSEHKFRAQFPSVLRYPSVVQPCMQYREHFRNRGQRQNFRALLEHGLPWATFFGPTSLDWDPENSTKGRGIQEATGNSQIAKLLASQEEISRGGVLRHVLVFLSTPPSFSVMVTRRYHPFPPCRQASSAGSPHRQSAPSGRLFSPSSSARAATGLAGRAPPACAAPPAPASAAASAASLTKRRGSCGTVV